MTNTNDEHDRIRAAIGTLLDDAPEAPVERGLSPRATGSTSPRWLLAAAAAAIVAIGVVGLVSVNSGGAPEPSGPAATPAPVPAETTLPETTFPEAPATAGAPSTDPFDPDNGDVAETEEFRRQTEDFLNDSDFVEDDVGGDISGATCDAPVSVAIGTTYRCVADVEGAGQYEFDVRIEDADTYVVENPRPI